MLETEQGEQRPVSFARPWLILTFSLCLFLLLGGASLFFASVQRVSWIGGGLVCTCLLIGTVLAIVVLLARLAMDHRLSFCRKKNHA